MTPFGDVQPALALLAEAVSGQPVAFEIVEDSEPGWPAAGDRCEAPTPGVVRVPPNAMDRIEYRTLLLHQLLQWSTERQQLGPQRTALERLVFTIIEDHRITGRLRAGFPGTMQNVRRTLDAALATTDAGPAVTEQPDALIDAVHRYALGQTASEISARHPWFTTGVVELVTGAVAAVEQTHTSPADSVRSTRQICALLAASERGPQDYSIDELAVTEVAVPTEGEGVSLDGGTPTEVRHGSLGAGGQMVDSIDDDTVTHVEQPEIDPDDDVGGPGFRLLLARPDGAAERRTFFYDEWDYHERRHRPAWCRVVEEPLVGEDSGYIGDVRARYPALRAQIRRQLLQLRPQELVRVHRSPDGDELDIDAAIEAIVDRRSGAPPDERLHIRRDRAERDVATVFLVDLSASTSSPAVPVEPEPDPSMVDPMDDPLSYGPLWGSPPVHEPARRVIDVAKDAVALMGDALEELGDRYAIYGFSGSGRDNVEFKIGKDFADRMSTRSWSAVAAMKPLRYTRMGPAIRHAAYKLRAEAARTRLLIVVSDGYPQDEDYGRDRQDRDYGLHDTARALEDATSQGIQTFCLTIDPAGHDYLRTMCPDRRYGVIEDVESLPAELASLYLSQIVG